MTTNFNQFKDDKLTLICFSTVVFFHSCFSLLDLLLLHKMWAAHYFHKGLIAWTQ